MSRSRRVEIDPEALELLTSRTREEGLTKAELARRAGVDRSTVTRILNGTQSGAMDSTLRGLASVLRIEPERLGIEERQLLEIDEQFISVAERTLREELERLGQEVSGLRATRVTASIGLQFHGPAHERRTIERVFPVERGRRPGG